MRKNSSTIAAALLIAVAAACVPVQRKPTQASTTTQSQAAMPETERGNDRHGDGNRLDNDESLNGDGWWPVTPKGTPSQTLINDAYAVSFNSETLLPNWVAWRLTASHADGKAKRKDAAFTPDERIDETHRVTTYDYMRSGYDRGHMCPAGDNKWSEKAMRQCFLMTNICPQSHGLNTGDWNEMENQCRRWARQYGEIYIACGPVLFKGKHKRIGKAHRVTVPEAFFKVVLCMKGKPKAIGFIYRNEAGDRPKSHYVNTVDQVERITGLDFFSSLPDDIEREVEASASLDEW